VRKVNDSQRRGFIKLIEEKLWNIKDKTIGVWGIAFKPNTDDIRNAAAIEIIQTLQEEGATIKAYDPKAMDNARRELKGVKFCVDAYEAAEDCDCLLLLTEWPEFRDINFIQVRDSMRQPVIFDGRNFISSEVLTEQGFDYHGIGRGKA
jgi:UDPglucose 6-dehydrogenase